jgi:hypothetical protein
VKIRYAFLRDREDYFVFYNDKRCGDECDIDEELIKQYKEAEYNYREAMNKLYAYILNKNGSVYSI